MKKHKMAGKPVKIENGPLKGRYFKVIEYLTTQYQGKDIKKLAQTKQSLIEPVTRRGMPLDDGIVFGQLVSEEGTNMTFACVHDNELVIQKPELKVVKGEQDGSERSSEGTDNTSQPGESKPRGRGVSSKKSTTEPKGPSEVKGQTDSDAGSEA